MSSDLDQYWSEYYEDGKDFRLITSQALTKVLEHVDSSLPKTSLDIGCGTGQLTRELYHRGYRCTGIDSSSKAIELARANTIAPELTYLHIDFENDDVKTLGDTPYSLITCKLVLAFIQYKEAFLRSVRQLLATGGSFVVISPAHMNDADATPISIHHDETTKLLQVHFETATSFELEGLSYFIAK